jgi:hypothetical protein
LEPPVDIFTSKSDAGVSIKLLKNIQKFILKRDEKRKWTTKKVIEKVIRPLTKATKSSLIQALDIKNRIVPHNELEVVYNEVVHDSDIYVSHAWSGNFHALVEAIDNFMDVFGYDPASTYFWVDLAAVNQWSRPLKRAKKKKIWYSWVLRSIVEMHKHTLLICDPWDAPYAVNRIWCLWEVYCTLVTNSELSVGLSNKQVDDLKEECRVRTDMVLGLVSKVDVRKGKAYYRRERKRLLELFSEEDGGIEGVNKTLNDFLQKRILQQYTEYSFEYIGKYHVCLAKKKIV